MKKVLAVGPTPEEEQELRRFCQRQGWDMSATPRIGRPRGEYPIQNVKDALRRGYSIWATAKMYGLSPGTVKRIRDGDIS